MRRSVIWVLVGLAVGLLAALYAYVGSSPHAAQTQLTARDPAEALVNGARQDGATSEPMPVAVNESGAPVAANAQTGSATGSPAAETGISPPPPVPATATPPPPPVPPTAEGFRNAVARYQESFQEHKRALRDSDATSKPHAEFHKALQQLVCAACGQWGGFPMVRAQLASYVDWREVPRDMVSGNEPLPGYEGTGLPDSAVDALPMVYYLDCEGRDGRATAMVHIMVQKGPPFDYVRFSPFGIANVEGRLYFSPDIVHRDPSPGPPVSNASVQIVGTVDIQQPLPAVVVMQENYTSSAPVGFTVCGFNATDGKWYAVRPDGWTGIHQWQYESQDNKLTLFTTDQSTGEGLVSEVVDMREWVAQHGPWKKWK